MSGGGGHIPAPLPPTLQPPSDTSTNALPTLLIGNKRNKQPGVPTGLDALRINLGSMPAVSGLTLGSS